MGNPFRFWADALNGQLRMLEINCKTRTGMDAGRALVPVEVVTDATESSIHVRVDEFSISQSPYTDPLYANEFFMNDFYRHYGIRHVADYPNEDPL